MAWVGLIRVNGTTYKWLGNDLTGADIAANVTNIQITPTRSIFVMTAGLMNVTVTFLSPVEVGDSVARVEWPLSDAVPFHNSPTTGSSSQFLFPTYPSKPGPWMETAIRCRCTLISVQVRLGTSSNLGRSVDIVSQSGNLAIGVLVE